jgi:hypothetical protein
MDGRKEIRVLSPPFAEAKTVDLPTGRLAIRVLRSEWPLGELCGFSARYNTARGYLFVSKVLGKHYPARPATMGRIYERLAARLAALKLSGPTVVIAAAETATGLGRGVFEAIRRRRPVRDWVFLHTTRYALNRPIAFRLTENHCHARDHVVYEPLSEKGKDIFRTARNAVFIDDEMSTGDTMLNLGRAFRQRVPGVGRIVPVCIKCWVDAPARSRLFGDFPLPVEVVSLLEGTFSFTPIPVPESDMPKFNSVGDWQPKDGILSGNFGRLGLTSEECAPGSPGARAERAGLRRLRDKLSLERGKPVLVLGTGEFTYPPYTLARLLEEEGFDVTFQSTTRTPVRPCLDIAGALRFTDNYHDGIDNFLYNVSPESGRQTVICYETRPPLPVGHDLPRILGAQTLFFGEEAGAD